VDIEVLEKIGLTKGESKTYLALLGTGQSSIGPIVKESGMSTSKSYEILSRLEQKGLVSHVFKNKTKYFKAANPERVLELVTNEYKEIEKKKKQVEKIIPQLIAYQNEIQSNYEAEIYYGLSGLETLFYEQLRNLKKGEDHYVIGITHFKDYPKNVALFFKKLQTMRDRKGIISNYLFSETARGTFDYMKKSKSCKIRHLPFASLVSINVYNDVTIISIFIGQPILFKITSNIVAENFIEYFKILWKQGEK